MALLPNPARYKSSDEQWAAEAMEADDEYMRRPLTPITMFGAIAGLSLWSAVEGVGKAQETENPAGTPQPTKDP